MSDAKADAHKAKMDAQERAESLAFLKTPDKWPMSLDGQKCHVKRRRSNGEFPETGVILASKPLTIYKFRDANPYAADPVDYTSVDAMISDNWIVD